MEKAIIINVCMHACRLDNCLPCRVTCCIWKFLLLKLLFLRVKSSVRLLVNGVFFTVYPIAVLVKKNLGLLSPRFFHCKSTTWKIFEYIRVYRRSDQDDDNGSL